MFYKTKQRFHQVKQSWVYKNFQLVVIIGLILGIALKSLSMQGYFDFTNPTEITYAKVETAHAEALECIDGQGDCVLETLLEYYTQKNFEENHDYYMELARMDAFDDINEALLGRLDDSPHYDYAEAAAQFGY